MCQYVTLLIESCVRHEVVVEGKWQDVTLITAGPTFHDIPEEPKLDYFDWKECEEHFVKHEPTACTDYLLHLPIIFLLDLLLFPFYLKISHYCNITPSCTINDVWALHVFSKLQNTSCPEIVSGHY